MDRALFFWLVGLFITVISGFLAIGRRLGQLETKIDTMWDWWQSHVDVRVGGRRRTDVAADDNGE